MKRWSSRFTPSLRLAPFCPPSLCEMLAWCASPPWVDSPQRSGVTLIGPPARDSSWQAHTQGAFDTRQFQVDWERQVVPCPMGKERHLWLTDHQGELARSKSFSIETTA